MWAMIDILRQIFTPCSWSARMMGYVRSIARVRSRYLRCELAWAPHLIRTRSVIEEAMRRCSSRRRAVVLGAGLRHDIPLKELSREFREVVLVDIVHPWHSRWSVRKFGNVRLVTHDVTEVMAEVYRVGSNPSAQLPTSCPQRFCDDGELDLTISVNLLSQLPVVPERFLLKARSKQEAEAYGRHLIDAHLDYLQRLPGHVALIADIEAKKVSLKGDVVDEWGILYGAQLPTPDDRWEWCLAPSPEQERGFHFLRNVVAFVDWKQRAVRHSC